MGNSQSVELVDPPIAKKSVSFQLNGREVVVHGATPLLTLNDWLRAQPGLSGTKRMCGEGGCGCCVVAAVTSSLLQVSDDGTWDCHLVPDQSSTIAINSVSYLLLGKIVINLSCSVCVHYMQWRAGMSPLWRE